MSDCAVSPIIFIFGIIFEYWLFIKNYTWISTDFGVFVADNVEYFDDATVPHLIIRM